MEFFSSSNSILPFTKGGAAYLKIRPSSSVMSDQYTLVPFTDLVVTDLEFSVEAPLSA